LKAYFLSFSQRECPNAQNLPNLAEHEVATYNLYPSVHCSPNFLARGPLLASKNNHGYSHPCWRKHSPDYRSL